MMIPVFITNEGVVLERHTVNDQPTQDDLGTNETPFEELCRVAAKEAFKASTYKFKERS